MSSPSSPLAPERPDEDAKRLSRLRVEDYLRRQALHRATTKTTEDSLSQAFEKLQTGSRERYQ